MTGTLKKKKDHLATKTVTEGIWKSGRPPDTDAILPTVVVSIPKLITNTDTTIIPTRGAGIAFVILGKA